MDYSIKNIRKIIDASKNRKMIGEDDSKNTVNDWGAFMCKYVTRMTDAYATTDDIRTNLIKIGGLALSALDILDTNGQFAPTHYQIDRKEENPRKESTKEENTEKDPSPPIPKYTSFADFVDKIMKEVDGVGTKVEKEVEGVVEGVEKKAEDIRNKLSNVKVVYRTSDGEKDVYDEMVKIWRNISKSLSKE
jgi:hypothetical protein